MSMGLPRRQHPRAPLCRVVYQLCKPLSVVTPALLTLHTPAAPAAGMAVYPEFPLAAELRGRRAAAALDKHLSGLSRERIERGKATPGGCAVWMLGAVGCGVAGWPRKRRVHLETVVVGGVLARLAFGPGPRSAPPL